jgi:hypothetical protein
LEKWPKSPAKNLRLRDALRGCFLQFVGEEKEFEHVTGSFQWYFSVYLLLSHFQGQPFFWGVEWNDHQI